MRQSNIELCRLASILLVMLVHSTTSSLGYEVSLGVHLLTGFTVIGVNVFVLITGYFSTNPKKSSLANLAFICLFWMIVRVVCRYGFGEPVTFKHLFFITSSNWFIASYIGLLFLTPILNSFCKSVPPKTALGGVIFLLIIEMWFDWLPPHPDVKLGAQNGYSVFSFAVLYLLGRVIRLYGLPHWFKKTSVSIYVICSLLLGTIAHLGVKMGHHGVQSLCFSYINPFVILSSIAFLVTFEKMSIRSQLVNHIAKSTLAVLLGHSAIFFLYTKQFKYIYDNFSGIQVVGLWILSIVIVFTASIVVDQIRLLLYHPIERLMKSKIKSNNIFE